MIKQIAPKTIIPACALLGVVLLVFTVQGQPPEESESNCTFCQYESVFVPIDGLNAKDNLVTVNIRNAEEKTVVTISVDLIEVGGISSGPNNEKRNLAGLETWGVESNHVSHRLVRIKTIGKNAKVIISYVWQDSQGVNRQQILNDGQPYFLVP